MPLCAVCARLYTHLTSQKSHKHVHGSHEQTNYPVTSQLTSLHNHITKSLDGNLSLQLVTFQASLDTPARCACGGFNWYANTPQPCDRCKIICPAIKKKKPRPQPLDKNGKRPKPKKSGPQRYDTSAVGLPCSFAPNMTHKQKLQGAISWTQNTSPADRKVAEYDHDGYFSVFMLVPGLDMVLGFPGDTMHLLDKGNFFNSTPSTLPSSTIPFS
jgi:hypothetical protein